MALTSLGDLSSRQGVRNETSMTTSMLIALFGILAAMLVTMVEPFLMRALRRQELARTRRPSYLALQLALEPEAPPTSTDRDRT